MTALAITPMLPDDLSDSWNHIDGMGYYGQAKIYEEPSQYGMFGGRISKLAIWLAVEDYNLDRPSFSYDRGFDFSEFDPSLFLFVARLMEQVDGRNTAWRVARFYWARITAAIRRAFAFAWEARHD